MLKYLIIMESRSLQISVNWSWRSLSAFSICAGGLEIKPSCFLSKVFFITKIKYMISTANTFFSFRTGLRLTNNKTPPLTLFPLSLLNRVSWHCILSNKVSILNIYPRFGDANRNFLPIQLSLTLNIYFVYCVHFWSNILINECELSGEVFTIWGGLAPHGLRFLTLHTEYTRCQNA